jgi:hypothetical protein
VAMSDAEREVLAKRARVILVNGKPREFRNFDPKILATVLQKRIDQRKAERVRPQLRVMREKLERVEAALKANS